MDNNEKRIFPRSNSQCPVLYRFDEKSPWRIGKMQNLSATGISFITPDDPLNERRIYIHIKPGSQKTIPELIASGEIVRTNDTNNNEFILSCKLTDISRG